MKRIVAAAAIVSLTLLGAGTSVGQVAQPDQSQDSRARTMTGIVRDYQVGKWLAIERADKSTETFKLDDKDLSVTISDSVAVGARVKVTEKVGADGKHTLRVELEETKS